MGQRGRILTQVLGYQGWRVADAWFERADGTRVTPLAGYDLPQELLFVLLVERRWVAHCAACGAACKTRHEQLKARRWHDCSWAGRPVAIEYAPMRLACGGCGARAVEMLAFAEPYQRQTQRLQQQLALECASAPVAHVAAVHGLDWSTVFRAEFAALERWQRTRPPPSPTQRGVDEKYLGRRGKRSERFLTIVSDNTTGEPLWIGEGRREATLAKWLATQTKAQKAQIQLFVMDMHRPFLNAVQADADLAHAIVVHDPFHVIKRVNDALDELRREVFFRAGPEQRRLGRGKRWLYLRSWENSTEDQKAELRVLFRGNRQLARGHEIAEEIRGALHAPTKDAMGLAFTRILLRTERRANVPLRKLHDSLKAHLPQLYGLAEHRPATGRVEALNNNWETLVRRARGYRNHPYLLLKLRFMVANPIRSADGIRRFKALGLPPPLKRAA